jgi:hypothetical protein
MVLAQGVPGLCIGKVASNGTTKQDANPQDDLQQLPMHL